MLNSKLLSAAKSGDTATVEALLGQGADMEAKDNDGWTALMQAAKHGQTATVEALLGRGADIQVKNNYGWTALMHAAMRGHTATVEALLAGGADVQAKNKEGLTALRLMANINCQPSVKLLAIAGAEMSPEESSNYSFKINAFQVGLEIRQNKAVIFRFIQNSFSEKQSPPIELVGIIAEYANTIYNPDCEKIITQKKEALKLEAKPVKNPLKRKASTQVQDEGDGRSVSRKIV